jgi:protein-tyrosine phosphatase
MIPIADLHCHLLAGMDDGPRTEDDALAMCRIAYEEGTRLVASLAHQNEHYAAVTPDGIREAAGRLAEKLREQQIALTVFATAEIMLQPDLEARWRRGELLSVADRSQFLLLEMPDGFFVDARAVVQGLRQAGVRVLLAHPERHEELLYEDGRVEELIAAGCLVQVSSRSISQPKDRREERALRNWVKRGIVHVLGSDGHSCHRRPPHVAAAYHRMVQWGGSTVADRICSTNGMAILHGLPLQVPQPEPQRNWWPPKFW